MKILNQAIFLFILLAFAASANADMVTPTDISIYYTGDLFGQVTDALK